MRARVAIKLEVVLGVVSIDYIDDDFGYMWSFVDNSYFGMNSHQGFDNEDLALADFKRYGTIEEE